MGNKSELSVKTFNGVPVMDGEQLVYGPSRANVPGSKTGNDGWL